MPTVTITLIDTPTGGVAMKTGFTPAVGQRCSAAQSAALDIINRICREFGLANPTAKISPVLRDGVDIDAVQQLRRMREQWAAKT